MTEEENIQTPASHNDAMPEQSHNDAMPEQPHEHAHIKKPSRWKRVRKRLWAAIEKLALKLLSKLLNISPPPSPTSESRRVNN